MQRIIIPLLVLVVPWGQAALVEGHAVDEDDNYGFYAPPARNYTTGAYWSWDGTNVEFSRNVEVLNNLIVDDDTLNVDAVTNQTVMADTPATTSASTGTVLTIAKTEQDSGVPARALGMTVLADYDGQTVSSSNSLIAQETSLIVDLDSAAGAMDMGADVAAVKVRIAYEGTDGGNTLDAQNTVGFGGLFFTDTDVATGQYDSFPMMIAVAANQVESDTSFDHVSAGFVQSVSGGETFLNTIPTGVWGLAIESAAYIKGALTQVGASIFTGTATFNGILTANGAVNLGDGDGDAVIISTSDVRLTTDDWQDPEVADDITLTNITQITNRSHSNLQNLLVVNDHDQYYLETEIDDVVRFLDGSSEEGLIMTVVNEGGNVTYQVTGVGVADEHFRFGGIQYVLDMTPSAETILAAGTDIAPTLNYVFVTESGGNLTLTDNTTGFPTTAHSPLATVLVQSAASVQTDGVYKLHAWTDHSYIDANNGHLSHVNAKIRSFVADWDSGVAPSDLTSEQISVESGQVFQLHQHTFPAIGMVNESFYAINDPTTAYLPVTTFDDITQDANGNAVTNKYVNFVVWGVVSENNTDSKVMINLPTAVYTTAANAIADADATAIYTIPADFRGTGFLIARYTLRNQAGTWTQSAKTDLRGLVPSTSVGGAGGAASDHSILFNLAADDHTQYGQLADGEVAAGVWTFSNGLNSGGGIEASTGSEDIINFDDVNGIDGLFVNVGASGNEVATVWVGDLDDSDGAVNVAADLTVAGDVSAVATRWDDHGSRTAILDPTGTHWTFTSATQRLIYTATGTGTSPNIPSAPLDLKPGTVITGMRFTAKCDDVSDLVSGSGFQFLFKRRVSTGTSITDITLENMPVEAALVTAGDGVVDNIEFNFTTDGTGAPHTVLDGFDYFLWGPRWNFSPTTAVGTYYRFGIETSTRTL